MEFALEMIGELGFRDLSAGDWEGKAHLYKPKNSHLLGHIALKAPLSIMSLQCQCIAAGDLDLVVH